jgi:hypothetical protein
VKHRRNRARPSVSERFRLAAADLRQQLPDDAEGDYEAALTGDMAAVRRLVDAAPNAFGPYLAEMFYRRGVPDEAFRTVLTEVWDHDHQNLRAVKSNRVIAMFRTARFPAAHLPDPVRVWRGESGDSDEPLRRLSWTLDRDTACWFATMWPGAGANPRMLVASVLRRAVLMHHTGRGEDEIVTPGAINPVIDGSPDDWREGAARHHQARRGHGG